MKRVSVLIVGIIFVISFTAMTFAADKPIIKMGTGGAKGIYNTVAGPAIAQQVRDEMTIEFVPGGSAVNIKRLKAGEIQLAIIQGDALPDSDVPLAVIGYLHPEYMHFIVRQGGKINEFSDLNEKNIIAVGSTQGGSMITWDKIRSISKKYAKVQTDTTSGARALAKLEGGQIDGVFYVTGLKSKYIMEANLKPEIFELVEVDANGFKEFKYAGKPIYEEKKIDSKTYPGLIQGALNWSQTVWRVRAVLVCTDEWANDHDDLFEVLYSGSARALPTILSKTGSSLD